MCGRYNLRTPMAELAELFDALPVADWESWWIRPRFNIAPTQTVPVIRVNHGQRRISGLRWGLIPFWAKDSSIGSRMINARAETIAVKPAFRSAFKRRRCVVPVDGFFEWQKRGQAAKQPFHIMSRNEKPLALAGIWESWTDKDRETVESVAIVTTQPNELMARLHDRMPVILSSEVMSRWLDPDFDDTARLEEDLVPCDPHLLRCDPVSKLVNNPRNDSEECVRALPDPSS